MYTSVAFNGLSVYDGGHIVICLLFSLGSVMSPKHIIYKKLSRDKSVRVARGVCVCSSSAANHRYYISVLCVCDDRWASTWGGGTATQMSLLVSPPVSHS